MLKPDWATAEEQLQTWRWVFQNTELGSVVYSSRDINYFAEYPAELADRMAFDLLELVKDADTGVLGEPYEFNKWDMQISPLTEPEFWYRLLQSSMSNCPVNFGVCIGLRDAVQLRDAGRVLEIAERIRRELVLFGHWLEVTGLWEKRPDPSVSREWRARKDRLNSLRDATWCDWRLSGMTESQIRDRWNREHPNEPINVNTKKNGLYTVRNAIRREMARRKLTNLAIDDTPDLPG